MLCVRSSVLWTAIIRDGSLIDQGHTRMQADFSLEWPSYLIPFIMQTVSNLTYCQVLATPGHTSVNHVSQSENLQFNWTAQFSLLQPEVARTWEKRSIGREDTRTIQCLQNRYWYVGYHVFFLSLMTVNVGNSVLTSFLSLLNVQLSILDLGLPTLASHCFLHTTTTTTITATITTTTTLSMVKNRSPHLVPLELFID